LAEPLSTATIESFRNIGLALDRRGRFWHQGVEVTHARTHLALLRWLGKSAEGRDIIRLDDQRFAYVTVEDAHLRATRAVWFEGRCQVTWDDESTEELAYSTVCISRDNALYAAVRGGSLRGRIAGAAYLAVAEQIEPVGDAFMLRAAGSNAVLAPCPSSGGDLAGHGK
jgi:hypothetical protein